MQAEREQGRLDGAPRVLLSAVAYELIFESVRTARGSGFPALGSFAGALAFFVSDGRQVLPAQQQLDGRGRRWRVRVPEAESDAHHRRLGRQLAMSVADYGLGIVDERRQSSFGTIRLR